VRRAAEAKAVQEAQDGETLRQGNLMRLGCGRSCVHCAPATPGSPSFGAHHNRLLMAVTMTLHNLPEGFAVRKPCEQHKGCFAVLV
jgi:zinc transporter ZupT